MEMAVSLQQLILDVNKLTNRLKDDESASDKLITQAKSTHNHVTAIKEFSEDAELLNEAAQQRAQSELRESLKREIDHLKVLRDENRALRSALVDYENALEYIMSKYRKHVSQLLEQTHYDIKSIYDLKYTEIIMEQGRELDKGRYIMRKVAELDEQETLKEIEIISQLTTENKGLRELIHIQKKYGELVTDDAQNQKASETSVTDSQDDI